MLKLPNGLVLEFDYINWRGEFGHRKVKVKNVYFGFTKFHSKEQWIMEAYDLVKQADRFFAISDMSNIKELNEMSTVNHEN